MTRRAWRPGRFALVASEAVLALVVALPGAATGLVALGAVGALAFRPDLVVLAFFLAVEELPADSSFLLDAPRALTAGTELYRARVAGLPLPLLLVGAAAAVLALRRPVPGAATGPRHFDRRLVAILAGLCGWCMVLSVVQDEDPQMARVAAHAVAAAGPWLAALAAYAVGVVVVQDRRKAVAATVAGLLLAKAALGVVMELLTGGVTVDGQRFIIFYDAALPTLAAAVLIARVLVDRRTWPGEALVVAAASAVVVLSFRRAVWLFVAVALVALPLVRRRAAVTRRVLMILACVVGVLAVAPSGLRAPVVGRVLEAVSVVQGETSERNSSQLHLDDITAGVAIARSSPWDGIGVRALQPPGLALPPAPDRYLYVHNDLLQTWLRFGLPGLVLLALLFAHLAARSLRLLAARGRLDLVDAAGAVFAGGIAVPAMTAAFLSTTWRFPVLLGLAAAVLDRAHAGRAGDEDEPRPAPAPRPVAVAA